MARHREGKGGVKKTILNLAYDEAFYARFPLLYNDRHADPPRHPFAVYGVECGTGWKPLLERLSEMLEGMISKLPKNERRHTFAVQVKQKLGDLRFYLSCSTDAMEDAIREATEESARTCELCGRKAPHKCQQEALR